MTSDIITTLLNMNYWYLCIKERHINDGIIEQIANRCGFFQAGTKER
jgi:hypothetical protein